MGETLNGKKFAFIYSCNALDHTQDVERTFASIRDALTPDGIAVISLFVKEGEAQNYEELHKYNFWLEGGRLLCSEKDTAPRDLLSDLGGLTLARVYYSNETDFGILLRRC
jgi:SAM-dependent methyltransferase